MNRSKLSQKELVNEILECTKFTDRNANGNATKYRPLILNKLVESTITGDWSWFRNYDESFEDTHKYGNLIINSPYIIKVMQDSIKFGMQKVLTDAEKQIEKSNEDYLSKYLWDESTLNSVVIQNNADDLDTYLALCHACVIYLKTLFEMFGNCDGPIFDRKFAYADFIGIEVISCLALRWYRFPVNLSAAKCDMDFLKNLTTYVVYNYNNLLFKYCDTKIHGVIYEYFIYLDRGIMQWDELGYMLGQITPSGGLLMKRSIDTLRYVPREFGGKLAVKPTLVSPFISMSFADFNELSNEDDKHSDEDDTSDLPSQKLVSKANLQDNVITKSSNARTSKFDRSKK